MGLASHSACAVERSYGNRRLEASVRQGGTASAIGTGLPEVSSVDAISGRGRLWTGVRSGQLCSYCIQVLECVNVIHS